MGSHSDKIEPEVELEKSVKNRRAVVTGASSGIGRAIAEKLLDEGWSVLGLCRTDPGITHPGMKFVPVDLLDAGAFDSVLANVGSVDAIVHSAGLLRVGRHDEMDLQDGEKMWRLHMHCAAQLIKQVTPGMPDGGRIVLIGSRVAEGVAGRSLYAASKAALIGFSRSVAAEVAPRQITVNVIAPGATDTPMLRDPSRMSAAPKIPPIGRFVKPTEIAELAAFLLSNGAASLTGQHIVVCGGASL
jgi:NAD(P)-dependent dehydrogenase (short-subunit alcohol dehydrogenase family)